MAPLNMQSPYTQQAYAQYPSTPSHNSGSLAGYSPYPAVTDFMTPGFSQRVAQSYNAQPYTTQDIYRDQPAILRTGPGYGNDSTYGGGSIAGPSHGPYHAMPVAGSWGTPAPQPLQSSDYWMPSTPYTNLRQGEPYYTGYPFGTEQAPGPTMNFSPRLPKAVPNQDAWRFHNCWVSRAEGDEIHLTIALKKS